MIESLTRTLLVVFAVVGVIFAVAVIILTGCAPATYVKDAPPTLKPEPIPPRPHANAVWIGGQWTWQANHYTWTPGHWEAKPRADAWVPGHWQKTGRGWIWVEGRWSK